MMKIFTNEIINKEDLDYSRWETYNGDYVDITTVSTAYLERSMDMLEQYMKKYPKHTNYPIWQKYVESLEEEYLSREFLLIG